MFDAPDCNAQSPTATRLDIDTDVRASKVIGNKSADSHYTGSLGLRTGFAGGWTVDIYGHLNTTKTGWIPGITDLIVQQASVEKTWSTQRLQVGLVRLPFGIYDYRETYASGLIDYPMPRVDYGLRSLDWGVPGAKWSGGTSKLQVEAAGFAGRSSGVWGNFNDTVGGAVRVQAYFPGVIIGASHWQGTMGLPDWTSGAVRHNSVHMDGIDIRYTRPHLVVRGELLYGALGGRQMEGAYVDVYYHLPKYQRITLVARAELLKPDPGLPYGDQLTFGIRYIAHPDWVLAMNWRTNNFNKAYQATWTPYSGSKGALFLQIYHKARL